MTSGRREWACPEFSVLFRSVWVVFPMIPGVKNQSRGAGHGKTGDSHHAADTAVVGKTRQAVVEKMENYPAERSGITQ